MSNLAKILEAEHGRSSEHNLHFAITTSQFAIDSGTDCKLQNRNCKLQIGLALIALLVVALAAPGCSRAFYRRQADWDAYNLIKEKATHPHWDQGRFSIAVDPRSRMFDPYCADCTPMPPDDPAAHEFMHCVDGKRGWPFWHDDGDTANVENPAWPAYLQFNDRGVLTVSSEDAVRIALLNSPNYQQNLEQPLPLGSGRELRTFPL